jgi:hypothetical protein
MPADRVTRHASIASIAAVAVVVALAVVGAATAVAAYDSLNINVSKRTITVNGSVSRRTEAIQVDYDPSPCASYATETKRHIQYSAFHPKHAGFFTYNISRASLHGSPHHVCAYLLAHSGRGYKAVASISGAL